MPYCSSDAWVGDAGPESNDWGFYFKGQRILEAALKQLQQGVTVTTVNVEHFLNHTHATNTVTTTYALTAADKVLFGGCSAGGRGALFNLDYVQSMLPAGAPPVLGFFDSALWVDMLPLDPSSEISLENETQQIFALVNATARLGDACAAAYPGDEGWRCLYGQYRLPYVTTPYLLSASQFDRFQLPYNEGSNPPYAPGPNLTYALTFQAAVRTVMLNLPTAAQPRSAVYSSACYKHCTSTLAYGAFWGVKVGDVSLKEYLAAWCVHDDTPAPHPAMPPTDLHPPFHDRYFGSTNWTDWTSANAGAAALPAGLKPQRIDPCTDGYACGQCHSKVAAPQPPLPPAYTQSLLAGAPPLKYAAAPQPKARHQPRKKVATASILMDDLALFMALGMAIALAGRVRGGGAIRSRAPDASLEMVGEEGSDGEEEPLLGARA